MNRSLIVISLIAMPLLNACSPVEIRSDIKEFVASFSLADSIEAYKEAGYTSDKKTMINGVLFTEKIDFYYNVKDPENPSYEMTTTSKSGTEEEKIVKNFLEVKDGEIFYIEGEKDPVSYSQEQVVELIKPFFYKQTMYDGAYHSDGMYYGDFILEIVRELQAFVTIDTENELYCFNHSSKEDKDGVHSEIEIHYSVNKLGMLTKNISRVQNGRDYVDQEINVYKV